MRAQEANVYLRAKQAFAAKNFRQAANLFAQAAADPQYPDALLLEARCLANLNDAEGLAAAEPIVRGYLQSNLRSSDALYLLGYILERENKPRESLEIFTRAAAIAAPQPDDLKLVALDYVLLSDYTDAAHWLTRSLAADADNEDAWYSLGRVHMEQGNFVEAERDFRRALALNSGDAKAHNNLGLSLEAQNRTDEALAAYREAVAAPMQASHTTEQPLLNLGTLLNAKGRSPEAVEPLRQAVAVAPGCARCHEELARAYLATGQQGTATAEMERAVALDPKNPRFHYQLGQIYRRSGESGKADAEFKLSSGLYGSHSTNPER